MRRILTGLLFVLLACFSFRSKAQSTEKIDFTPLDVVDTLSAEKMAAYSDKIALKGLDAILAKKNTEYGYYLMQKRSNRWVVYEFPVPLLDTADCLITGQFILYQHTLGNSTRNTSWSSEETFVIDVNNHAYISVNTNYELQEWGDPPAKRKNETSNQYEKRVEKSQEVTRSTKCMGKVTIKNKILTVWLKCTINGVKISPKPDAQNSKQELLADIGTYLYKGDSFYRIKPGQKITKIKKPKAKS